jgi:hypothetical protein
LCQFCAGATGKSSQAIASDDFPKQSTKFGHDPRFHGDKFNFTSERFFFLLAFSFAKKEKVICRPKMIA